MEVLRELLQIIATKSDMTKTLPEAFDQDGADDKNYFVTVYIKGILDGTFATDADAAKAIYGTGTTDQRYRTLKSRVYDRLIRSILQLQVKQPEHSEYLSYYYKCTRNMICAQSLIRFASRKAGFEIAERTMAIANKYQFTDINVTLSKLLCETAAVRGYKRKFELYRNLTEKYLAIQNAEYRSDFLLDQFLLAITLSTPTIQSLSKLGIDALKEIEEYESIHHTHTLILNKYRVQIALYEVQEERDRFLVACNQAIVYLESNPHLSQPARLGEFRLRKIMMLLMTQNIEEAYSSAESVYNSFREGGNNWYVALYFSAVACLRFGDYGKAREYHSLAIKQRQFAHQNEATLETWTIIEAYVTLAERLILPTQGIDPPKHKKFDFQSYINSVPEESKKKKIANTVILVSHVCFLTLEKDFAGAEARIDYIKVYASRYIREKHYNRVRTFLRMLQNFAKCSFDPYAIRSENTTLYKTLKSTSKQHTTETMCEYIQFEVLYEALLGFLEKYELGVSSD